MASDSITLTWMYSNQKKGRRVMKRVPGSIPRTSIRIIILYEQYLSLIERRLCAIVLWTENVLGLLSRSDRYVSCTYVYMFANVLIIEKECNTILYALISVLLITNSKGNELVRTYLSEYICASTATAYSCTSGQAVNGIVCITCFVDEQTAVYYNHAIMTLECQVVSTTTFSWRQGVGQLGVRVLSSFPIFPVWLFFFHK